MTEYDRLLYMSMGDVGTVLTRCKLLMGSSSIIGQVEQQLSLLVMHACLRLAIHSDDLQRAVGGWRADQDHSDSGPSQSMINLKLDRAESGWIQSGINLVPSHGSTRDRALPGNAAATANSKD